MQALEVFRLGRTQRRYAQGVLVGLDLPALIAIGTALQYEPAALAHLLPALEAGMIRGRSEGSADDA